MDSKRLVPVLHVLAGRVVDPAGGRALGAPAAWAQRLELEGADEILFVELDRLGRRDWLVEAARTVFIPLALEAPFRDADDVAAALEDGAGRVVIPARDVEALGAARFGRARIMASLETSWDPGWNRALAALRELGGAGEVLLSAGERELADLCARAAHLATPVLLLCPDPALAAEALAHGADGIAYPAALRTTAAFKALLAPCGVALRR